MKDLDRCKSYLRLAKMKENEDIKYQLLHEAIKSYLSYYHEGRYHLGEILHTDCKKPVFIHNNLEEIKSWNPNSKNINQDSDLHNFICTTLTSLIKEEERAIC